MPPKHKTNKIPLYDGIVYETPPIPELSTIKGSHLPKKDQVWYRNTEYEQWSWNEEPKFGKVWFVDPDPGQMEWYEAELERILEGEWVMMNGKPVFFNAFCYFFHQWFVTKEGGYPYYKDTSLVFYYFIELVYSDPKCRGANVMKGRRIGVSTMVMSIMLQFTLIKQNTEQGIVSKTGIDAEKIFKLMLVNGFVSLPPFLKPRISGNDTPVKVLHVTKQAERGSKVSQGTSSSRGLNNKVEWRATSANVFDGDGLWTLLLDEAGKWEEEDISAYLPIAMKIIQAGKQRGRILMVTTVNKAEKGGDNYKPIWYGSDYNKLDKLGQTSSKLWRLFIEGYRGMDGWIDKYGNSVVDTPTKEQTEWLLNDPNCLDPYIGSKEYCDIQRENLVNDPELYMEEVRMVPYNPEEVFKSANNLCHFNLKDLNDQTERLATMMMEQGLNPEKDENGRRGEFRKIPNGQVVWIDNKKDGMWYVLEFLDPTESNKQTKKRDIYCPDNTAYGAAGLDPIANAKQTIEKGSDACCVIFKRYNPLSPARSGMPVAMFLGRPKIKSDFHNQIFWGLEYYGVRVLAERSPTDWEDYAITKLLASDLEQKKKNGYLVTRKLSDDSEAYGIAAQDKQAHETHLTEMVEYALNNMDKIYFMRILKDMLKFNIKERTVFDACMAFGYSLMALREAYQPPVPKEKTTQMVKTYRLSA